MKDMKRIKLNQIALWSAKPLDEFTIRKTPAGREYEENNAIKKTLKPCYRYAKNYTINDNKFCLFVFSYSIDNANVEAQLDEISKKISKEEIEGIGNDIAWTKYKLKEI